MSINVTIVTTANRTRRFSQTDEGCIHEVLKSLQRSSQLFTNRTLIIGSGHETEVFSPAAITRIEIETARDMAPHVPQLAQTHLTLIPDGTAASPAELSETHLACRIDFFFHGGDTVPLWISAPRPGNVNERLMLFTRLFEQTLITYKLPAGGVGFMNPANMIRAQIASAAEHLPLGTWHLNPL